jgi:hypothetical protein
MIVVWADLGKKQALISKVTRAKRDGGLGKYRALA